MGDNRARFEIIQLTPAHNDWVKAILTHSNVLCSPLWPVIYPENKTERAYQTFEACEYLSQHQITSGLSCGIIDRDYQFKREESAAKGGALYWDTSDATADRDDLLNQMDFPLVAIALSYDAANPLDMAQMTPLIQALPAFATLYEALLRKDTRDPQSWQATGPGQVLHRNGTATRMDYERHGLTKKLAHHVMLTAKEKGYRGIQIETVHDAVRHIWANPPPPFKSQIVSECMSDEEGLQPATQQFCKIYTTLS